MVVNYSPTFGLEWEVVATNPIFYRHFCNVRFSKLMLRFLVSFSLESRSISNLEYRKKETLR